MSRRNSTEIVHEGWLTKSPPIKRIWRARWRRRWFVLRQTGELPGQYFLEYYTDRQCLKLKGRVDLDQCEQVDAGLQFENGKLKYLKHLFDLRTPKRIYYLAADTEADMNKWVDCVCQVCGLKADNHEDEYYDYGPALEDSVRTETQSFVNLAPITAPLSPPTTPSTPYILMSECYSGRPPPAVALAQRRAERPTKIEQDVEVDDFYDAPRCLHLQPTPPGLDLVSTQSTQRSNSPPQSPGTDSVFSEDEWPPKDPVTPGVNWSTFPRDSSTSDVEHTSSMNNIPAEMGAWSVARRFSKVTVQEPENIEPPPPRPPKPSHLAEVTHSYLNLSLQSDETGSAVSVDPPTADDMYDFPRSHHAPQGTSYTNAAPISGGPGQGVVFRYDFASTGMLEDTAGDVEPSTPKSETGSMGSSTTAAVYSNLPSPAIPPCVNRELKPGRRLSDSTSNEPSPGGPLAPCSPAAAPSVDRKLKPRKLPESPMLDPGAIPLAPAPTLRDIGARRRIRAAPSPTPPGPGGAPPSPACISLQHYDGYSSCSDDETRFRDSADEEANFYYVKDISKGRKRFDKLRLDKVKYLDLDHDTMQASTKLPSEQRPTVYNTVDFVKTKAFNRTRQEVELERQSPSAATAVQS